MSTHLKELTSSRGIFNRGSGFVLHAPAPARRLTFSGRVSCESVASMSFKIILDNLELCAICSTTHGTYACDSLYRLDWRGLVCLLRRRRVLKSEVGRLKEEGQTLASEKRWMTVSGLSVGGFPALESKSRSRRSDLSW